MNIKEIPEAHLWAILQSEYGIRIIPKRALTIPTVTLESIRKKIKPRREGPVLQYASDLNNFLTMHAVDDKFGTDHMSRVQAIGKIKQQFGPLAKNILKHYADLNQFRVNKLSGVHFLVKNVAERLGNPERQVFFQKSAEEVLELLGGEETRVPYRDMKSLEEKLTVVHQIEDAALNTLVYLSE